MNSQLAMKAVALGGLGYAGLMIVQCPCESCVACSLPKFAAVMASVGVAVLVSNWLAE